MIIQDNTREGKRTQHITRWYQDNAREHKRTRENTRQTKGAQYNTTKHNITREYNIKQYDTR